MWNFLLLLDPGSENRDQGWIKIRIRVKHPGSATRRKKHWIRDHGSATLEKALDPGSRIRNTEKGTGSWITDPQFTEKALDPGSRIRNTEKSTGSWIPDPQHWLEVWGVDFVCDASIIKLLFRPSVPDRRDLPSEFRNSGTNSLHNKEYLIWLWFSTSYEVDLDVIYPLPPGEAVLRYWCPVHRQL